MRFNPMIASLVLASIALGAPEGGAPVAGESREDVVVSPSDNVYGFALWLKSSDPIVADDALLIVGPSRVESPSGDEFRVGLGLLPPGFTLLEGAAVPFEDGGSWASVYDPDLRILLEAGVLLIVAPAPPPPVPAPGGPGSGWPSVSCGITCSGGYACCYPGPNCVCQSPAYYQQHGCVTGGGPTAVSCYRTEPYIPPSWNPPAPSPPASPGVPAPQS